MSSGDETGDETQGVAGGLASGGLAGGPFSLQQPRRSSDKKSNGRQDGIAYSARLLVLPPLILLVMLLVLDYFFQCLRSFHEVVTAGGYNIGLRKTRCTVTEFVGTLGTAARPLCPSRDLPHRAFSERYPMASMRQCCKREQESRRYCCTQVLLQALLQRLLHGLL